MTNYKAMVIETKCSVCNRPFYKRKERKRHTGYRNSLPGRARQFNALTCSPKCSRARVYYIAMYGRDFRVKLKERGITI